MGEWISVKDRPGYFVSRLGEVKKGGDLLRQYDNRGYKKVLVSGRLLSVHRLVAAAFIENTNKYPEVNHKDGNKSNNHIENLEWCTRSQNMKHAYKTGLHPGVILSGENSPNWRRNGIRHPQSMAVMAIFPNGKTKKYDSQGLAANDGFTPSKISQCINGKRRYHGGAKWMPLPPPPEQESEQ